VRGWWTDQEVGIGGCQTAAPNWHQKGTRFDFRIKDQSELSKVSSCGCGMDDTKRRRRRRRRQGVRQTGFLIGTKGFFSTSRFKELSLMLFVMSDEGCGDV